MNNPFRFFSLCASLLSCAFLSVAHCALAQQFLFENFDYRHGIVNIRAMAFDNEGNLWLGTSSGLVRYDGEEFEPYPLPIVHNQIVFEVATSQDGSLWIQADTDSLLHCHQSSRCSYLPSPPEPLRAYLVRPRGTGQSGVRLYPVGTKLIVTAKDAGLWLYDPEKEEWTHLLAASPSERVLHFAEDQEGRWWVATEKRLGWFSHRSGTRVGPVSWTAVKERPVVLPRLHGGLWLATEHGLYVHYPDGRLTEVLDESYRCFLPATDKHGNLVVLVEHGAALALLRLSPDGVLIHRIGTPEGLVNARIADFVFDHEGGLWLGHESGLSYLEYPIQSVSFTLRAPDRDLEHVHSIVEDSLNKALWISTYGGLYRYREGYIKRISKSLRSGARRVLVAKDGSVHWAEFTRGEKLFVYRDGAVKRNVSGQRLLAELEDGSALYQDIESLSLVRRYEEETTAIAGSLGWHLRSYALSGTSSGQRFWMISDRGLETIQGDTLGRFTKMALPASIHGLLDRFTIPPGDYRYITLDSYGRIWVASSSGLVCLISDASGRWSATIFDKKDGLISEGVTRISTNSERLWITTHVGVQGFSLHEEPPFLRPFREYGTGDDLLSGPSTAILEDEAGYLWISLMGTGKIIRLNLNVPDTLSSPSTRLSGLFVNGVWHPDSSAALRLRADTSRLAFDLAANTFRQKHRVRYQYRMLGLDSTWNDLNRQRSVQFANLPPRRYTFEARAVRTGSAPGPVLSKELIIVPPFYQATWFYLLSGLSVLALALTAYSIRIRLLKRREQVLEQTVAERTSDLVAEKHKTEEQAERLLEMDKVKSRFFANISHEFRTPLTLIAGPLQDALDQRFGAVSEELQRQHGLMLDNAKRLLRLINQLLDLAKLESKKLDLNPLPGDVALFLRQFVEAFIPLAERRGISLHFESRNEKLPMRFDRDKLEKVFSNLLSNALKFTPEGGKVAVVVSRHSEDQDAFIEVAIKDTGPGIPQAMQARIFDRFQQVDGSATRHYEGTGLGLALTKELVELHGGTITLESNPGFGSTFVVGLPVGNVGEKEGAGDLPSEDPPLAPSSLLQTVLLEEATLEAGLIPSPVQETASPKEDAASILLVEDNAEVRAFVRRHLEEDYHLLEAADGEDGLAVAREHLPDLVLSDVMMPRMDGYTLCQTLKADDRLHSIPVILLTAKAAEQDKVEGLDYGADDYMAKPFSIDELKARIANLVLSRRQLRQRLSREIIVQPAGVSVPSSEEAFLQHIMKVVNRDLSDCNFGVDRLAEAVGMTRRQLTRKFKTLPIEPPGAFIRSMRLEKAKKLLEARAGTIKEIAYNVGFKSPSHFSTVFHKKYGISPSAYLENGT